MKRSKFVPLWLVKSVYHSSRSPLVPRLKLVSILKAVQA